MEPNCKNQRLSAEERGHKGRNRKLHNDKNTRSCLTNNKHREPIQHHEVDVERND